MDSKYFLFFGFLVVTLMIASQVAARDLAEVADVDKEVKGVEDAKYGGGGYYPGHGGGGQYGGGGGQYGGGGGGGQHGGGGGQYGGGGGGQHGGGGGQYGGGGGGQHGGGGGQYGGGGGGQYGGGCHYGCCGHHGYNGCSRCCAVNEQAEAKPNN